MRICVAGVIAVTLFFHFYLLCLILYPETAIFFSLVLYRETTKGNDN